MDILKWQKDKTWFGIVGGLRTYKNMIMRGDPDSNDGDIFDDTQGNQLASAQDRRREAHRGEEVFDIADAQVVTSESLANPFVHKVLLDIDHPAVLIPSTTGGHYHLLIDVEVPWEKYVDFMDAAAEAGILEKGFVKAARARGFSTLRMPWIKKELGAHTRKPRPGRRPSGTVPVHEEWLTSPIEQRTGSVLDRLFPESRRERLSDPNYMAESLDDSYEEVQGMMLGRGIEAGPPIMDEAMRLSAAPRMSPQQFYDNLHRQNQDPFTAQTLRDHNEHDVPIENRVNEEPF